MVVDLLSVKALVPRSPDVRRLPPPSDNQDLITQPDFIRFLLSTHAHHVRRLCRCEPAIAALKVKQQCNAGSLALAYHRNVPQQLLPAVVLTR